MQQLSGSSGRGGIGTPLIVFHVASGEVPGLYRDERPGPARRVPKTMAILSCGVCSEEVVVLVVADEVPSDCGVSETARAVGACRRYGELDKISE